MILDRSIAGLKCDASAHIPRLARPGCGTRFERVALRETLVRFWARIGKTEAQQLSIPIVANRGRGGVAWVGPELTLV